MCAPLEVLMPDLVAELAERSRALAVEDRSRLVEIILETLYERKRSANTSSKPGTKMRFSNPDEQQPENEDHESTANA